LSRVITLALALAVAAPLQAQQHTQPQADERLGRVHFATSCAPSVAPTFDRGVALLHSFEFGASIRAFNDVLASDSTCAMAYWGLGLSRWTNPMAAQIRAPALLAQGKRDADEALRRSANATERERGYIRAVAELYREYQSRDQESRVSAYERAMRELTAREAADTEATIFHALALAATASSTDKTYAKQLEAGRILEELWPRQPDHPGIAHYIIHAYDYPPLADKARQAAQRYAAVAPSAAHALHMPSHTFTRVGMWEESVKANIASMETALRTGSIAEALHAADYLVYAYLQMGKTQEAKALLDTIPAMEAVFDPSAITGAAPGSAGVFAIAAMRARWVMERSAWAEAAALEPKTTIAPWAEAMTHFARALGASQTRSVAKARASVDSLDAIARRLQNRDAYWAEQVAIQHLGARAWLELAQGRDADALRLMREAVAREDATEKNAVTPGPLAPARELLGDMLTALKRPAEAQAEYRAVLKKEPNRRRAILALR
jgi:hypothetical protein